VLPVLTKNFVSCAEAALERTITDSASRKPLVVFRASPLFHIFCLLLSLTSDSLFDFSWNAGLSPQAGQLFATIVEGNVARAMHGDVSVLFRW